MIITRAVRKELAHTTISLLDEGEIYTLNIASTYGTANTCSKFNKKAIGLNKCLSELPQLVKRMCI